MSRRSDYRMAELVDIALLTRAAFEERTAEQYCTLVGVPLHLAQEVLSRPLHLVRTGGNGNVFRAQDERRRVSRN